MFSKIGGQSCRNIQYDIIGEKTVADAILDRLVHDTQRIELWGESLRKKSTKNELEIT